MARWKPNNDIGLNEQVGRRLFDEPKLKGFTEQPPYSGIPITHFEEMRGDEISLDRLGKSGFDRKVARYLLPRATAAGQKFAKPKPFEGWAVFPVKELIRERRGTSLQVVASPVTDPEPDDNIYHAHVVRPEGLNSMFMALYLRHIFEQHGRLQHNEAAVMNWRDRIRRHPVIVWIVSTFFR